MISVAVCGALGRMGSLVSSAIHDAQDLELSRAVDRASDGDTVGGIPVVRDAASVAGVDVVVDFTNPDTVLDNLRTWSGLDVDCVVGTSGFDAERIDELRGFWNGAHRCLVVPNFTVGAALMMRIAEMVAPFYPRAEIIELHHDGKADAPSGTSLATAERIAAERRRVPDPVGTELVEGARGASASGVPIHSVRLGGLVAHQIVIFGGEGETLTIRHDSLDRASFLPGVLAAVRRVATLPPGVTVGLDQILEV